MALELNGTTGVSLVQDGVVATADLADNAVTSAKLFSGFANGITEIDSWRLNNNFSATTGSLEVFTQYFERDDSDLAGKLGTGMSESSGIFTFPSTGYWDVGAYLMAYDSNGGVVEMFVYIDVSTDSGSNYDRASVGAGNIPSLSGNPRGSAHCRKFFKVTDASTTRLRFRYYFSGQSPIVETGAGFQNQTYFTFVKMAEV